MKANAPRRKVFTDAIDLLSDEPVVAVQNAQTMIPVDKIVPFHNHAFKFNREIVFETTTYQSLEQVIRVFMYAEKINRFSMFKENVRNAFIRDEQ